jgi:hypothetical protein
MSTLASRLLDGAVDAARDALDAAKSVDIHDHTAVITSQAQMTAVLERLLWAMPDSLDNEPDIAAQVAAEDGIRPASTIRRAA